jgi:hypothetical protein
MSNNDDRNSVSVKSWMLMIFVTAIPIIGVIMGSDFGSIDGWSDCIWWVAWQLASYPEADP